MHELAHYPFFVGYGHFTHAPMLRCTKRFEVFESALRAKQRYDAEDPVATWDRALEKWGISLSFEKL